MKKILNVSALIAIFGIPILIILSRYETERTIEVDSGLGFVPTVLLALVAIVAIGYVLFNYKEVIRQHPFGSLALLTYGVLMVVLIGSFYLIITNFVNAAQTNLDAFTENITYHTTTMFYMIISISAGILLIVGKVAITYLDKLKG